MDPLVSVIVPTRNRHDFLERALSSISEQTYDAIETIVVDGSTTPLSYGRVRAELRESSELLLRRGPRRGAGAARNVGITAAKGEFLAFLDDDDEWEPTKIERQVDRFAESDPSVGVVYTGQRSVNSRGETIGTRCPQTRGMVTEPLLRGADMTPFSGVMVEASLVPRVGLLDEQLPVWEDLDWYIRLSQHCAIESITQPLLIRTMGDHTQLTDQFKTIRDRAFPRFVRKHRQLAASYGSGCERAMVASRLRDLGHTGLEQGYHREARALLGRAVRTNPTAWRTYPYFISAIGGSLTYRPARWLGRQLAGLRQPAASDPTSIE